MSGRELDQVGGDVRTEYLDWFTTLPLWLDLGGLRGHDQRRPVAGRN